MKSMATYGALRPIDGGLTQRSVTRRSGICFNVSFVYTEPFLTISSSGIRLMSTTRVWKIITTDFGYQIPTVLYPTNAAFPRKPGNRLLS
jgi:hypothetical protein